MILGLSIPLIPYTVYRLQMSLCRCKVVWLFNRPFLFSSPCQAQDLRCSNTVSDRVRVCVPGFGLMSLSNAGCQWLLMDLGFNSFCHLQPVLTGNDLWSLTSSHWHGKIVTSQSLQYKHLVPLGLFLYPPSLISCQGRTHLFVI